MKKIQLITGVTSLVLAGGLVLLNLTKIELVPHRTTTIILYPAGFFALLGVVLVFRFVKQQWLT